MSSANYAHCEGCDRKAFYKGEEDIPEGVVIWHQACLHARDASAVTVFPEAFTASAGRPSRWAEADRMLGAVRSRLGIAVTRDEVEWMLAHVAWLHGEVDRLMCDPPAVTVSRADIRAVVRLARMSRHLAEDPAIDRLAEAAGPEGEQQ